MKDYPDLSIGSEGRERRLTTSIFSLNIFYDNKKHSDDIEIIGLIDNKRVRKFIECKYIEDNGNLNTYKVIVPKSNGSGAIGEVLSTPILGEPILGYTQSFIGIGNFKNKAESTAALKYIKTKFARTMLGILKVTQDNSKKTWKYVPLQDFTESSDIDWSKSIHEIDEQLYAKYGLSDNEIQFIENKVQTMA